jgi:hypothetical protein
MSSTNLSPGGDDFRAAAGLASWSADALDLAPDAAPALRGPGLFEVISGTGQRAVTNVRRLAGAERPAGSRLILAATVLLGLLAAGLFVVSLAAQYRYVFAVKHQSVPSGIEAVGLDVGMAVFSLLALGLAMAGQPARIERGLIVVCAVASAGQNYAAADVTSPRSVAAYVVPPLFLALVVDRVVAVVRRHVLGGAERSVWAAAGRGLGLAARGSGVVLLYLLRLVLAPPSTSLGLRRWVLVLTPLPAAEVPARADGDEEHQGGDDDETEPPGIAAASKRARLAWWYERDPGYGRREAVATAARRLAPKVGLGEGTARAYIGRIVAELEQTRGAS